MGFAVRYVGSVTAIVSSNDEEAMTFAEVHKIPTYCGYERLLSQPVDAILSHFQLLSLQIGQCIAQKQAKICL